MATPFMVRYACTHFVRKFLGNGNINNHLGNRKTENKTKTKQKKLTKKKKKIQATRK